jgi:ppGpp synthetase/RelA/SpoT-type nucleotidyltranferase
MASKAAVQKAFLARYAAALPRLERATRHAVAIVRGIVIGTGVDLLGVDGRPKELGSVREKLRRKLYTSPWTQLTDKIGVRVMTYYGGDVETVVAALKDELEIDSAQSVDKRSALGLREFGYRSVHLIARLSGGRARSAEYADLGGEWFEIQVRSVFEHAWAEIEHEVVYKSGVEFPDATRRRFAALAGTLELLEREFAALRREPRTIVDAYSEDFRARRRLDEKLDVARFLAAVGVARPESLPFLGPEGHRLNAPASTAKNCVQALRLTGVRTPRQVFTELSTKRFLNAAKTYASESRVPEAEISQLASAAILIGIKKSRVLEEWLPDLLADRALLSAIAGASKRRANAG